MTTAGTTHPPVEELTAFALGTIDDDRICDAIEEHLTGCDACGEQLSRVADDELLTSLRNADTAWMDGVTEVPARPHSGEATADDHSPRMRSCDIPAELLDHPRYRILEQQGQGGMGDVYRAEHRVMQRTVALKLINERLIDRPEIVERFHREVRGGPALASQHCHRL